MATVQLKSDSNPGEIPSSVASKNEKDRSAKRITFYTAIRCVFKKITFRILLLELVSLE
jgi:hypothetical protein